MNKTPSFTISQIFVACFTFALLGNLIFEVYDKFLKEEIACVSEKSDKDLFLFAQEIPEPKICNDSSCDPLGERLKSK